MSTTGNKEVPFITSSTSTATKNTTPKDDYYHIKDLIRTPPVVVPVFTYMSYISLTIKDLFFTLIFNWSMAFIHPLNFLLLITLIPLLSFALLILEISFNIGSTLGLGKVLDAIGHKWGGDLTLINWWDPRMFSEDVAGTVTNGISALGRPLPEPAMDVVFNIDIAELLLFMSSIIYERDDKIVHEVYNMIANPNRAHATEEDLESAAARLKKSESRICEQAESWGLEFISLSELNSLGGPFSGMFYSKKHNFIVVVFKGTTPTDFSDYVTDLMLQRVDASSYVFGEIHGGMYTNLFSRARKQGVKMNDTSPYSTIIHAIKTKAADIMKSKTTETPVNVWVTGHSLGAALASIFFARCLKSPEDLGPCILRDTYVFGCPAIGNSTFASMFSSYSNEPLDRPNTLWRIVNDTDIIAHLSGFEDKTANHVMSKHSLLDYTHVGEEIRFFRSGTKPKSTRDVFHLTDESGNPLKNLEGVSYGERFSQPFKYVKSLYQKEDNDPLEYVELLMPTFFRNHIPGEYFKAMQKARKYFDEDSNRVD